jgi:hypothetical protein
MDKYQVRQMGCLVHSQPTAVTVKLQNSECHSRRMTLLRTLELCILTTQCVYVFCIILTTSSSYCGGDAVHFL